MKKTIKAMTVLLAVALLLTACNFPLFTGQSDEEAKATSVAQTVEAINTENAPPSQPTNTLPSLPTLTPAATSTLPAFPTQTPLPCNKAQFVSETVPDDTQFDPNEVFTDILHFKNIGTCTWSTNYKVVFSSGDAMGGPASQNFSSTVAPNETVEISLNLTAPSAAGTYKGIWKLRADDGEDFATFWVQIKVGTGAFAVTSVIMSADESYTGPCPYTFNYSADITTNGAGMVTYYVTYSSEPNGPTKSMTYDAAGTKTINGAWDLSANGSYWVKVYIDNPNHQLFNPINFTLVCVP